MSTISDLWRQVPIAALIPIKSLNQELKQPRDPFGHLGYSNFTKRQQKNEKRRKIACRFTVPTGDQYGISNLLAISRCEEAT